MTNHVTTEVRFRGFEHRKQQPILLQCPSRRQQPQAPQRETQEHERIRAEQIAHARTAEGVSTETSAHVQPAKSRRRNKKRKSADADRIKRWVEVGMRNGVESLLHEEAAHLRKAKELRAAIERVIAQQPQPAPA